MSAPVVFSAAWFERHQRTLVTLLGLPLVGRLLRRILAIRPHDVGYHRRIVALLPHAYTVDNGDGTLTSDIRSHAKYAKRLYVQLLPLWRALHAWDMLVANPLCPVLNVGFDTLTTYPEPTPTPAQVAGWARLYRQNKDESWATMIDGATGNTQDRVSTLNRVINIGASATTDQWAGLARTIFCFDTHFIGLAGGTLVTGSVGVYVNSKTDALAVTPDLDVYTAAPANVKSVTASDWSNVGSTSCTGSAVTYAAVTTGAYNEFALNSTGLDNVNLTGVSSFSLRNANYDVAATPPTWTSLAESYISAYLPNQIGTSQDPRLVLTFAVPNRVLKPNNLRPRIFAPGRAR